VFVQSYGSSELDASLLLVPLVGFLPASDQRVTNTVAAIERELTVDSFVYRYRSHPDVDGSEAGEGTFLMCTFWMADNLAMLGRVEEARARFQALLDLRNDVGLLAEQYDPVAGRILGNFPQAFSHVSLANTATTLGGADGTHRRSHEG
jgi:GH15 family glucan-1,4-alpha-glucosidase